MADHPAGSWMRSLPNGYGSRSASLEDTEQIADLFNGIAKEVGAADTMAASAFRTLLSAPAFDIGTSTMLISGPEGHLVGYADVFDFEEPFTRFWGHLLVSHPHRDRGIEEALLSWMLDRVAPTLGKSPAGARVFLEKTVSAKDRGAMAFLRNSGFEQSREYLHMSIALDRAFDSPQWPEGIAVATVEELGDLEAFLRAKVEAFSDHYGRAAMSQEQQVEFLRHLTLANPLYDPGLCFACMDGDKIAGICNAYPANGIHADSAYIPAIAIREPWRRRGLGLALLQHTFEVLRIRGMKEAALHVDGESLTGASRLYVKAGMHVDDRNLEFQRTLRPASRSSLEAMHPTA